jgi:histidinol dehydrogenase
MPLKLKSKVNRKFKKAIAEKAIANSKLIYVENDKIALDLIDEYGPEHFIVCVKDEDFTLITLVMQDRFYRKLRPKAGDYASERITPANKRLC